MNTETIPTTIEGSRKWMGNLKLIFAYAMRMVVAWIIVFALAKLFHLERVMEIRFLNYLIMFFVGYAALKKSYDIQNQKMEYFTGMTLAFAVGCVASIIYAGIFFIYLHLDQNFTNYLIEQFPKKMLYPEMSIAFVIFSEGFSFSVIIALALLQYFKRKRGRWTVNQK